MKKARCAIFFFEDAPPERAQMMKDMAPPEIELVPVNAKAPLKEQVALCKDAEFMIAPDNTPMELLKQCGKLKLFQLMSAGYDRMNVPAVLELGVKVSNNGGANAICVAEQAMSLMLGVMHKIRPQYDSIKARKWDAGWVGDGAYDMEYKTVGIVGLGHIGKNVARMLRGWKVTTLYCDILDFPPALEKELKVTKVPFEELLRRSDIVTLHIPHNRQTHHMVGERELKMMKRTAILINTCRGGVIDEKALIKALQNKTIAAAGLDVFEQEDPPDYSNPLFKMENVLYTPHYAYASAELFPRATQFAYDNMLRVLRGEEPLAQVTPV
jgi:phosphoglycerate dehydrogenase-like enzyme